MQTRIVRASMRQRLEQPPEGWTVLTTAAASTGRKLEVGTEVSIKGERGRFRFMRRVVTDDGREWLDFWGGPKGCPAWRSFYADRIRRVHRVVTTDKNVLAAAVAGKAATP